MDQRLFLLYDSGPRNGHQFFVFNNNQLLQEMHDSPHWMCNGTFNVPSKIVLSSFAVLVLLRSNFLPCIFVMIANKQTASHIL